jgi:hypothetical protein
MDKFAGNGNLPRVCEMHGGERRLRDGIAAARAARRTLSCDPFAQPCAAGGLKRLPWPAAARSFTRE